jgi:hypothetical protein
MTTAEIGPDTPLRLKMAVKVAFPLGGMTLSGLRSEAKKGNLAIEVIAGKQFTTLKAIPEIGKNAAPKQRPKALATASQKRQERKDHRTKRVGHPGRLDQAQHWMRPARN